MKLILDGNINSYYIQTLCMIFFPGEKFGVAEQMDPNSPELYVRLCENDDGVETYAHITVDGKTASSEKYYTYSADYGKEKTIKLACGAVVIAVCGEIMGYRPAWGMLTGVRPSKVATELLHVGLSKTRVKKILTNEYFVIPKKAALATEVALNEQKLIGHKAFAFHEALMRFPSLQFCVNGHGHKFEVHDTFEDGMLYIQSDCIFERNFLIFTLNEDGYSYEQHYF